MTEEWDDDEYREQEAKYFYDTYMESLNEQDGTYRLSFGYLTNIEKKAWEKVAEEAYSRYDG